jgi:hypothetical protein
MEQIDTILSNKYRVIGEKTNGFGGNIYLTEGNLGKRYQVRGNIKKEVIEKKGKRYFLLILNYFFFGVLTLNSH